MYIDIDKFIFSFLNFNCSAFVSAISDTVYDVIIYIGPCQSKKGPQRDCRTRPQYTDQLILCVCVCFCFCLCMFVCVCVCVCVLHTHTHTNTHTRTHTYTCTCIFIYRSLPKPRRASRNARRDNSTRTNLLNGGTTCTLQTRIILMGNGFSQL